MGEETMKCLVCGTEGEVGAKCFNCGTLLEQSEPEKSNDQPAGDQDDQEEENEPESTGESAGETAEGEKVSAGGAINKLKSIFGGGKEESLGAEGTTAGAIYNSTDQEPAQETAGGVSSEPQSEQEA